MSGSLLVVAGEVSGDMHAAGVVREVSRLRPGLQVWGIGGEQLRGAGMEVLHDADRMAVLGFSEVVAKYGFFRRVFRELLEEAARRRPAAALLVDYPGFNIPLGCALHKRGIKVLYFISPQVWAWKSGRIRKMARCVERLMVIFPFEKEVFKGSGLRVDFVGHPLVEIMAGEEGAVHGLPWKGEGKRVALLPGSRRQEVRRILPVMLETLQRLGREVSYLIAVPNNSIEAAARDVLGPEAGGDIVVGGARAMLREADAALTASGTATVEAALAGCPMIIVYRTAWLTYLAGRLVVRTPYLGMVNIIAGQELCPEFVQHRARPGAIAEALGGILDDTVRREEMIAGLRRVGDALGSGGAFRKAAEIVVEELGGVA